jgi:BioD-like phosphotransacetylase family protein
LEEKTGNIYQSLVAVSKRSNQISTEIKEELTQKLQEFATTNDNLEEVFENREQIEISKHYEKMPKAVAIATQELLDDKIYMRIPEEEI